MSSESNTPVKADSYVRLARFTRTYVPFALLLSAALLAPEVTQNLELHRTIYTIWATTALLISALFFFVLAPHSEAARSYWLCLGTFSYIVYPVHFYYAVFVLFGSIAVTFAPRPVGQGMLVAGVNFLLTAWWGLDVLLSWVSQSRSRWVRIERCGAHIFVFVIFSITLLRLWPHSVTKPLGFALIGGVVISILLRCLLRERQPA